MAKLSNDKKKKRVRTQYRDKKGVHCYRDRRYYKIVSIL